MKLVERISQEQLQKRISELAQEISNSELFESNSPTLVIGVLNGAVPFTWELTKRISKELILDFMSVRSYVGTKSESLVLERLPRENIQGKNILLVEDILDKGKTLGFLYDTLAKEKPNRMETVCLLSKPKFEAQWVVRPKWVGFEMDDEFLVGFGLDFEGRFRNKAEIFSLEFS